MALSYKLQKCFHWTMNYVKLLIICSKKHTVENSDNNYKILLLFKYIQWYLKLYKRFSKKLQKYSEK